MFRKMEDINSGKEAYYLKFHDFIDARGYGKVAVFKIHILMTKHETL